MRRSAHGNSARLSYFALCCPSSQLADLSLVCGLSLRLPAARCVAGLTPATIAIPEQMATAGLAGFSPEIGFFAFLAVSLAIAIFGESRFLSCGADSTIAPIFASGLALVATTGSADYATLAATLALMVGVLLVAGGFFRLGSIAKAIAAVGIAQSAIVADLGEHCAAESRISDQLRFALGQIAGLG